MRKKRILFCTEATFLNTGYATYSREILNYLYSTGKYEIAELAAYARDDDGRSKAPWKMFGVIPPESDEENIKRYKMSGIGQFGGFAFERVCLEFMPDIVCDIRDFWMLDFVNKSPFRKFIKWIIMPTVDAAPQASEWMYTYSKADACLSYSAWSGDVLKNQSGGKINYLGQAPPSAHPAYKPVRNRNELKNSLGIEPSTKIIGTVMRNQRRKLYPDLFCAFRKFLDSVPNQNEYKLYCHTSYPDAGWDIPELLNEYGLHSHTLFTYICADSDKFFVSPFNGAITQSPFTGNLSAKLSNVKQGLSYEELAQIINCFDLYVQYANCEGFGLPQVEAAACGVPVMSIDYSAMSSVIRELGGTPIPIKTLYKEMETGCNRAVPDNDITAKLFKEFFDKPEEIRRKLGFDIRQNFLEKFKWDSSGRMWEQYFDSVDIMPISSTWKSEPNIKQPAELTKEIGDKPFIEVVDWLFREVLCEPDKVGTHEYYNVLSGLMYGFSMDPVIGSYFNEDDSVISKSRKIEQSPYDLQKAYDDMKNRRMLINAWEQRRAGLFKA